MHRTEFGHCHILKGVSKIGEFCLVNPGLIEGRGGLRGFSWNSWVRFAVFCEILWVDFIRESIERINER